MRITNIRDADKCRIDWSETLATEIEFALLRAGFITRAHALESGVIKIGLGMKSFNINPQKLGYNADTSHYASKTKKGYKRTCTPTWEQREQFNHIINNVLDKHKLTASARNSVVTIRTARYGRINNWDMERFGTCERWYYEICKESELLPQRRETETPEYRRSMLRAVS